MPGPPPGYDYDITSFPYSQLVPQAVFNVSNVVWFRVVTAIPIVLGLQVNQGAGFTPTTTVYESDGTTVLDSGFIVQGVQGRYVILSAAGTYFVKVRQLSGAASSFDFTVSADFKPLDSISPIVGDILVNDDTEGFPTAIVSSTGEVKGYISSIPPGEMGGTLSNGISAWHDRFAFYGSFNRITLISAIGNLITNVNAGLTGGQFPKFAVDNTNNKFYVVSISNQLWTVTDAGVAANTGYTFPSTPQAIGVNAAGTILYWVEKFVGIIHKVNLTTLTDETDLHTISGFVAGDVMATTFNEHPGDLFVLTDGSVVTWWNNEAITEWNVIHVSAAGSLINQFTLSGTRALDHLAYVGGQSDYVYIWFYTDSFADKGTFGKFILADGSLENDFTLPMFSSGTNLDNSDTTMFGVSNSCTFIVVLGSEIPPEESGTIRVVKVTVPTGLTQEFEFTAGGGLSPSSFTLNGDGDFVVFLSVPAGSGYSITEEENDLYDTEYTVSNDSPIDNISVAADEVVIVTVTNVLKSAIGGGIYKIVPGKRNDTLWNENNSGTTDVKIPNPFGTSGMIGD